MGESNGEWGEAGEHDEELGALWDSFEKLPEPGTNDTLDAFTAAKRIDIGSLVRVGARLSAPTVLAFALPGGVKFRDMESGKRWTAAGSEFRRLKVIYAGPGRAEHLILAEGETDAARLTLLYPTADVAVMPAGAKRFTAIFAEQVREYTRVLIGTDPDEAGEEGAAKITALLPRAERFAPPAADWCALEGEPPALPTGEVVVRSKLISMREMDDVVLPDVASWFEHGLLPVGGQLVVHGWAKLGKSYVAMDMLAALAQGTGWCGFEHQEEPARVAAIQFEIQPFYFRDRLRAMRARAKQPELLWDNFFTWHPEERLDLKAGVKAQEDEARRLLVENEVQVVLIDPLRRFMQAGQSMNDEDQARYPLQFFESLQQEGITVVFCHHDVKSAARMRNADDTSMTGSGAFAGDADTIIGLTRPKDASSESPLRNVHFTLRNGPPQAPRGLTFRDDATLLYSDEPHESANKADDDPSI